MLIKIRRKVFSISAQYIIKFKQALNNKKFVASIS